MSDESGRMGVFVVVERVHEVHGAHPDFEGELPPERIEETLQRVGIAQRERDGGIRVQLAAVPMNGELIIRPIEEDNMHTTTITEGR